MPEQDKKQPEELPKLVLVERPDGSTVLVPAFAAARRRELASMRKPGETSEKEILGSDIMNYLTRDPAAEIRTAEEQRTGKPFDPEQYRYGDAVETWNRVLDQSDQQLQQMRAAEEERRRKQLFGDTASPFQPAIPSGY